MVTSATDNLQANQRNRPEQPENAYLANGTLPNELLLKIGAYVTAPKDKVALVKTCFSLHLFFSKQEQLDLKKLLFAIINDDRKTVLTLLDNNPSLLMKKPIENTIIKNKRTWQKFYAENPLTMAVKLKQIKMIEILLPYYEKLPQTRDVINAKVTALSTWKFYEMQNVGGEDEIVIPKEYEALAQSLIEAFKEEDFPNGVPDAENIVPYEKGKVPYNVILSEKTELALTSLLNILVPKNAVKLDEHVDSELFLLAIYKAYRNNVSYFSNDGGKDALCIRGMGFKPHGSYT